MIRISDQISFQELGLFSYRSRRTGLRSHHLTEDEVVFPLFEKQTDSIPYDLLVSQHEELDMIHESFNQMITSYKKDPSDKNTLRKMAHRFADHRRQHSQPPQLVIPFILYNLPPDERKIMESLIPVLLIRLIMPVFWKKKWQPMIACFTHPLR